MVTSSNENSSPPQMKTQKQNLSLDMLKYNVALVVHKQLVLHLNLVTETQDYEIMFFHISPNYS